MLVLFIMVFVPVSALAVEVPNNACSGFDGLAGIICKLQGLLNSLIPFLITLGVVYFVYGVVSYVIADGEEAKSKGRDQVIFGVIGLAVIIGLWGLVAIVRNTLELNGDNNKAPSSEGLRNLLPHNR